MKCKKLKWEQITNCFNLKLKNYKDVDIKKIRKMLEDVERPNPEYNKPFNKYASRLFHRWFDDPSQPLPEAAYTLLSNWFLTACSASKSSRAYHARRLWDALFFAEPDHRLTNWHISGRKVIPSKFLLWWKKQTKCQEDC